MDLDLNLTWTLDLDFELGLARTWTWIVTINIMTTCVALRLVDSLALFLVRSGADRFIMHSAVLLGHRSTVLTVDDGADLHERDLI